MPCPGVYFWCHAGYWFIALLYFGSFNPASLVTHLIGTSWASPVLRGFLFAVAYLAWLIYSFLFRASSLPGELDIFLTARFWPPCLHRVCLLTLFIESIIGGLFVLLKALAELSSLGFNAIDISSYCNTKYVGWGYCLIPLLILFNWKLLLCVYDGKV